MEKYPKVITALPLRKPERRRISRREALKQITSLTTVMMPAVFGTISYNDIQEVVSDPAKSDDLYQQYRRGAMEMLEGVGVDLRHSQKNSREIQEISNALGVNLISTHDAFEIAPVNNVINYSWDIESATLLRNCYSVLPSHFRKRDGNNMPLSIALGTERVVNASGTVEIGQYFPGLKDNVMVLAKSSFRPDMPQASLRLLTHENIHFLQDSGRSKLESVLEENHDWNSIRNVCSFIHASIEKYRDDYPNELNEAAEPLQYAAIDPRKEDHGEEKIRDNAVELEAVLGQVYLYGKDVFLNDIAAILGDDMAHTFYRYTKNIIFKQKEYESFPLF